MIHGGGGGRDGDGPVYLHAGGPFIQHVFMNMCSSGGNGFFTVYERWKKVILLTLRVLTNDGQRLRFTIGTVGVCWELRFDVKTDSIVKLEYD